MPQAFQCIKLFRFEVIVINKAEII